LPISQHGQQQQQQEVNQQREQCRNYSDSRSKPFVVEKDSNCSNHNIYSNGLDKYGIENGNNYVSNTKSNKNNFESQIIQSSSSSSSTSSLSVDNNMTGSTASSYHQNNKNRQLTTFDISSNNKGFHNENGSRDFNDTNSTSLVGLKYINISGETRPIIQ